MIKVGSANRFDVLLQLPSEGSRLVPLGNIAVGHRAGLPDKGIARHRRGQGIEPRRLAALRTYHDRYGRCSSTENKRRKQSAANVGRHPSGTFSRGK